MIIIKTVNLSDTTGFIQHLFSVHISPQELSRAEEHIHCILQSLQFPERVIIKIDHCQSRSIHSIK